jgi:hypothetical protein
MLDSLALSTAVPQGDVCGNNEGESSHKAREDNPLADYLIVDLHLGVLPIYMRDRLAWEVCRVVVVVAGCGYARARMRQVATRPRDRYCHECHTTVARFREIPGEISRGYARGWQGRARTRGRGARRRLNRGASLSSCHGLRISPGHLFALLLRNPGSRFRPLSRLRDDLICNLIHEPEQSPHNFWFLA